ncbi:MAG: replication-associated recombination protein A [Rhodocyclaceae bacterium]|nr:replication-associated recombination protein A [Rhodocyclaceae bacterium]MCA3019235.1 replication-associated recombination protein A [Rhodocyclaceae bacterium]MCA3021601.1 replication-associated recombination protein A [Rhodocyclaceae bacterium]MCA3024620.1 replication-associated recombination protein A [Rhodocyclaceae bacterium]MCA3032493.1 replication-associated recombination protein A [Rhodocyclaceae bacterium]
MPLAERLRPQQLSDVIGQEHLTGEGMPLRIAFDSQKIHSMILWGPPGVGKTSIARLMAHTFEADFVALSAVLSGVKEIRESIERAQVNRHQLQRSTILFVDEVHRFNKSQQDAFLPHVESGLITFIGATTENPSFELNNALLSRAAVYVLKPLGSEALAKMLEHALNTLGLNAAFASPSGGNAKAYVLEIADGDGRRLLNLVEQLATAIDAKRPAQLDEAFVMSVLARASRRFDKSGDDFYDQVSALHKSVRGSDPDASLYWFCRMLDGGADPRYLARRLIRMATEDIGLADPRALQITLDASDTYERLGSPEGELALAEAVVYLAIAAKSNAVYNAYNAVRALIQQDESRPVPMHIRNAPTKLMKDIGMGKGYRYAHDEAEAYAAGENYLPMGLEGHRWYDPTDRGLEAKIREKLAHLRALDGKLES